jgi:hypothetical protein
LAIPVNSQFNSHSTVSLHSVAAASQASLDLSPRESSGRVGALPYVAPCLDSSDEIPFAQFNTAVPQDVVGRGAVEIKVGQHEMHQIWLAFETQRVFTKG